MPTQNNQQAIDTAMEWNGMQWNGMEWQITTGMTFLLLVRWSLRSAPCMNMFSAALSLCLCMSMTMFVILYARVGRLKLLTDHLELRFIEERRIHLQV
jgi:predicted ferric reductase